jgi:hypothetical protein
MTAMRLIVAAFCTLAALPPLTTAQTAVQSLIAAIEGPQSDRDDIHWVIG